MGLLFQCLWNDLAASPFGPELTRWQEAKQPFSTDNPIVMTQHDREYGELGVGVASRTGNRYVTRFWDLTEFVLYRQFDAMIDIGRGVARMGDGDWLGVAEAKRFYAHHLHTFRWLPADERMHLVAHHPSLPVWAGSDGDRLVICACHEVGAQE